jgi:hypothetical protein
VCSELPKELFIGPSQGLWKVQAAKCADPKNARRNGQEALSADVAAWQDSEIGAYLIIKRLALYRYHCVKTTERVERL